MARRGRKPKPTALKILEGTRSDRVNLDEPKLPPVKRVNPPAGLNPKGRKLWRNLFPILNDAGILSVADIPAFTFLCKAYQATEVRSPSNHAMNTYIRLLTEFGLTPSSRSRLATKAQKRDDLAEFLEAGKTKRTS